MTGMIYARLKAPPIPPESEDHIRLLFWWRPDWIGYEDVYPAGSSLEWPTVERQ